MNITNGKFRSDRAKQEIADFFGLPRDSILDVPKMVIVGNVELSVENHLGIIKYTANSVTIAIPQGKVTVRGKDLVISGITRTLMEIRGRIESLDLLPESD
ncbi:MAG: sporulation protein YqfC [Firmicutes bacterium]|nr:sporulation protein YqfC [Bacillota bacterium]